MGVPLLVGSRRAPLVWEPKEGVGWGQRLFFLFLSLFSSSFQEPGAGEGFR